MRRGQNPAKDRLPAYRPPRLGIALVSYIPSPAGYYGHALEILKYQVASLHRSTDMDFDLLVFDNGSCNEVQAELLGLQAAGWIDFLVASRHNLGKIGALNWILAAMPNELICYSDSDVLFRPGWIERSLEILEAFPDAGMIAAQPCLDDVLRGAGTAHVRLAADPRYKMEERPLDPGVIEEYGQGVGLAGERVALLKAAPSRLVTDTRSGVRAVIGAAHMQFLMPRSLAQKILPLPVTYGLGREEDRELDRRVDASGALHLSTLEAYTWHMGNLPDEKTLAEVRSLGLAEMLAGPARARSAARKSVLFRLLRRLARLPLLRGAVYRLYNLLFELYAQ